MQQKTVNTYSNATISSLKTEIAQQLSLLKAIKAALPETLADHALHCILKNRELILFTDSGAWASQLRFYNDAMISAIIGNNLGRKFKLQIKILNKNMTSTSKTKKLIRLPSSSAIVAISEHSQNIKPSEIKDALSKLSATLSRLHSG